MSGSGKKIIEVALGIMFLILVIVLGSFAMKLYLPLIIGKPKNREVDFECEYYESSSTPYHRLSWLELLNI